MGWQDVYFGNTIGQYLTFLAFLAGGLLLGRALHWVIERIVTRMAARTRTKLDDVVVAALKGPFVFFVFAVAFVAGRRALALSPEAEAVFGSLARILFTVTAAWATTGLLDALLQHYLTPLAARTKTDLDEHLLPIFRKLVKVLIVIIAAIMILDDFNINVSGLLAGLGLGGLAFALAAQDLLGNMFGGMAILADKPFKLGDTIRIDKFEGVVKDIGIRTTRIQTSQGSIISVPNSMIAKTPVETLRKPS